MSKMIRLWCISGVLAWSVSASAQGLEAIPEELLTAFENWSGTPEELQELFDALPEELQEVIEEEFPTSSMEGGLGLGGGYCQELLAENGRNGGFFRLETSLGLTWAVSEYALPIYYAIPDLEGPWAVGFKGLVATDNFNSVTAGALFHWAYEFIGWGPHVDVGPLFRYDDPRGAQGGGHLEVGYGSILIQGYVQGQFFYTGEGLFSVSAGVRIPWLVFELLAAL